MNLDRGGYNGSDGGDGGCWEQKKPINTCTLWWREVGVQVYLIWFHKYFFVGFTRLH